MAHNGRGLALIRFPVYYLSPVKSKRAVPGEARPVEARVIPTEIIYEIPNNQAFALNS